MEEKEEEENWEGAASGFLTEPRAKQQPKKGKTTPDTRANKAGRTWRRWLYFIRAIRDGRQAVSPLERRRRGHGVSVT